MKTDIVVIGAGIVGLAIARATSKAGMETVIVEQEKCIAAGISARNSGVVHAGLYYAPNSLKAKLSVEGRDRLYRFCEQKRVPHRKTGKIIFAKTDDQHDALISLANRARANGIEDIWQLDSSDARRLEPALDVSAALYSPLTGIVDTSKFATALLHEAETHGAVLALRTTVSRISQKAGHWTLTFSHEQEKLLARWVINSAGLGAQMLASAIDALPQSMVPKLHYAKGTYFSYLGKQPFTHLIYPLPHDGGLGVHLTIDMNGGARFGPDVEWVGAIDYDVRPERHAVFYAAARQIWPEIDAAKLYPDFAGIRPKLSGTGHGDLDFVISGPSDHGLAGLINLFGIESPGLTSAMAIAQHVKHLIATQ